MYLKSSDFPSGNFHDAYSYFWPSCHALLSLETLASLVAPFPPLPPWDTSLSFYTYIPYLAFSFKSQLSHHFLWEPSLISQDWARYLLTIPTPIVSCIYCYGSTVFLHMCFFRGSLSYLRAGTLVLFSCGSPAPSTGSDIRYFIQQIFLEP